MDFGGVGVETRGEQHAFNVEVCLNDLDPKMLQVELYVDEMNGGATERQEKTLFRELAGTPGDYVYSISVSATLPSADETTRVTPRCDGVAIPLDNAQIG